MKAIATLLVLDFIFDIYWAFRLLQIDELKWSPISLLVAGITVMAGAIAYLIVWIRKIYGNIHKIHELIIKDQKDTIIKQTEATVLHTKAIDTSNNLASHTNEAVTRLNSTLEKLPLEIRNIISGR